MGQCVGRTFRSARGRVWKARPYVLQTNYGAEGLLGEPFQERRNGGTPFQLVAGPSRSGSTLVMNSSISLMTTSLGTWA